MPKFMPDTTMDAMLDVSATPGTQLHVCVNQPTDYASITTANNELATGAVTTDPIADSAGGREVEYNAVTGMLINNNGDAQHIAISNNTDTLYFVTTCTLQSLTSGGTVDTTAFKHTLGDPA
jgi:hypothetical protein